ncbi:hypothetical protein ACFWB2_29145 [Streptomyces virginiae]|uniref:hypothetical protein n=1 Tax=Streptomyces virginiae TaxID=1961 RepID=UPI003673B6D1
MPAGPATSSPSPPRSTPPTRTAAPRPAGTARGEQPRTAPNWIRDSHSSRLLAGLAAAGRPLPHDDLDDLARAGDRGDAQTVDYPRGVLVAYEALPERDELSARIERHLDRVVKRHPEHALFFAPTSAGRCSPGPAGREPPSRI